MNICTKVIQHSHMTIHSKDICAEELVKLFYTYTVESIAFKFFQACAAKVSIGISAVGIVIAWICLHLTLINIWKYVGITAVSL